MRKVQGVGTNDLRGFCSKDADPFNLWLYKSWNDMLRRVYNVELHQRYPTYSNCTVNKDFLLFSNWVKYLRTLPNYSLCEQDKGVGWCVDKDILYPGNKSYDYGLISIVRISENSSECAKRMNLSSKRKKYTAKRVRATNINNINDVKEYDSLQEAEKDGFKHQSISACCRGKKKKHKGYQWEYI